MQRTEHTSQPAETLRETAGNPTLSKETPPHIEYTTHTVEIHVKTIPSDEDHNPKSQIDEEIDKNTFLYRGVATF